MSTLFISYCSKDGAAGKEVQARLEGQGHYSLFLDFDPEKGIPAGANWERTLYAKLRACKAMIALCTDHSKKAKLPPMLTEGQYVDIREDAEEGYRRLWRGFKDKGIVLAEHREWSPADPPYPGLRSFEEEDAPIFFGRGEEIQQGVELLNRVRRQGHPRLVLVLGDSGSGKSSLARAGIVPQLRRDKSSWFVVDPFRPRREPARELASAMKAAFMRAGVKKSGKEILEKLELCPVGEASVSAGVEGGNALLELASELRLASGPSERSVLLVVDQFEELLSRDGESGNAMRHFLEVLSDSILAEGAPLIVLGTMRSEYLGALQRFVHPREIEFDSLSLGPIGREGMRQVILEPARLGSILLEEGLADVLLDDTETSDALPLLAFTLRTMWDRYRHDGLLEIREYHELGGLQGAIAQVAEEAFQAANRLGEKGALRKAFLRLAWPSEEGADWIRRSARWEGDFGEDVQPMLQCFVDRRLLVTREGAIEVAHEALFRSWVRLRRWLEEDREALHLLRDLERDSAKWMRSQKSKEESSYLWRGGRLQHIVELQEAGTLAFPHGLVSKRVESSAVQAFLNRSLAREARGKRTVKAVLSTFAALIVVISMFAWYLYNEQQKTRRLAGEAFGQQLAAQAQLLLKEDEFNRVTSLLLAVESLKRVHSYENRQFVSAEGLSFGNPFQISFLKHYGTVSAAAFSPDGRLVVTGSQDQMARVWDAKSGQQTCQMEHAGEVTSVAFSPDGRWVLTGSEDLTARVWDAESGQQVSFLTHEGAVTSVAFGPRGRWVISGSRDQTARVWEARSGQQVSRLEHDGWVTSVAFGPDGTFALTGSLDGEARIWEAKSGRRVHRLRHDKEVSSVAFSQDGRYVLTGSWDGTARVWNVQDGQEISRMQHRGRVNSVAFDPSGMYVLTGSAERKARVWEAQSGMEVSQFEHGGLVSSVTFSPDGRYALTGSQDGTARVWNPQSGQQVSRLEHGEWVLSAAFSPDGCCVLTAGLDEYVRIWETSGRQGVLALRQDSAVTSVAFSPDSHYVLTGGLDRTARVWEARTGHIVSLLQHQGEVTAVAFSPNGSWVLTASKDHTARVWETRTGQPVSLLQHDGAVTSAAFSPDGRWVLTGSRDSTARLWEAKTARPLLRLHHDGAVTAVAFSPGGRWVLTGSEDRTARVWDPESGECLSRMEPDGAVTSVAFSPDGRYVLTRIWGWAARVWETRTGQLISSLQHEGLVNSVAFSPDGRYVLTGSWDRTARVWEAQTGHQILRLEHQGRVSAVAFSPDGNYVLSSDDRTARVWDVQSGKQVLGWGHEERVYSVSFSPDGRYALTVANVARVHPFAVDALIETACDRIPRNLTLDEWRQYFGDRPYEPTCSDLPALGTHH